MIIRTAVSTDLGQIKQLFQELDACSVQQQPEHFQTGERSDAYLTELINREDSAFLVCIEEDTIIGFSLLFLKETKPLSLLVPCTYAYIQDFVVSENRRRQGYGTLLIEASKQWAKDHNAQYMRLSVIPDNEAGIRFYQKNGLYPQMITMECPLYSSIRQNIYNNSNQT
ncbi:MAG: GNAT family N-acetyltransferase [Clostridia bacterium]|nr:GNAT family N-acetyltransferase [Clostridia bacterium]